MEHIPVGRWSVRRIYYRRKSIITVRYGVHDLKTKVEPMAYANACKTNLIFTQSGRQYDTNSFISALANACVYQSGGNLKCKYAMSHPLVADGDVYTDERIMTSDTDVADYLIHLSSSPVISEVDHDFEDFEDTESESDAESDLDSEAQYITIPINSPWWRAPRSSDSPSVDAFIDSDVDDVDGIDNPSSSYSLSLILEKQQFLVGLFHDELRRIMPGDAHYEYNDDWLKEVDAKLLLAPVEAFEETCKESMSQTSRPLSMDLGSKPIPDVPIDFGDEDDDEGLDDWVCVCTL